MGFWHTGYEEFHEVTGLGGSDSVALPPVVFACDMCALGFPTREALGRHRFEQHPLRQPALLVNGRAVGTLSFRVFQPLLPEDVVVEDAIRCTADGVPVAPRDLGEYLAGITNGCVTIELGNNGAATRCKLDFRIALEPDLRGVECAFMRLAGDRVLDTGAVGRFIRECGDYRTAMPYCDGICHYLYGVMAREGSPDSALAPNRYGERFLRAAEELAGLGRPLAVAVRSLVAFHFNRFAEAATIAEDKVLRHAAGAFDRLLSGGEWDGPPVPRVAGQDAVGSLLTDQETYQVLGYATQDLAGLARQPRALLARLRQVSGYDRLKYILLAAEALAGRGDAASRAMARRLVREVAALEEATPWSRRMLETL